MSAERRGYPNPYNYPATPGDPAASGDPTVPRAPNGLDDPAGATAETYLGEPQPGSPAETAGLVRGLQAWMADMDRRLAIRTKLLLGLAAIAIGAAGAAIFLSVEANRTTASQEEFAELQREVDEMRQQLGLAPGGSEPADDAATEDDLGAVPGEDPGNPEADGATEDADAAAEDGSATEEDPEAVIEEAMRERFEELSEDPDSGGAPPSPEIGSD